MIQELDSFLDSQFSHLSEYKVQEFPISKILNDQDNLINNCAFLSKKSDNFQTISAPKAAQNLAGELHKKLYSVRQKTQEQQFVVIFSDSSLNYKKMLKNAFIEKDVPYKQFILHEYSTQKHQAEMIRKINSNQNFFLMPQQQHIYTDNVSGNSNGNACNLTAAVLQDCQATGKQYFSLNQGQYVQIVFQYTDNIFVDVKYQNKTGLFLANNFKIFQ